MFDSYFRKTFMFKRCKTRSVTERCSKFKNVSGLESSNTPSNEDSESAYMTNVYDEVESGSTYATITSQDCVIHDDLSKNTTGIGTNIHGKQKREVTNNDIDIAIDGHNEHSLEQNICEIKHDHQSKPEISIVQGSRKEDARTVIIHLNIINDLKEEEEAGRTVDIERRSTPEKSPTDRENEGREECDSNEKHDQTNNDKVQKFVIYLKS